MRVDLHVHSKFSRRPAYWFLQKIGCPESFTEPLHLYRLAKARGMSHVTIADHNCIDGALEIAHRPDVFISEEVTTYFPEDQCKIHVLALNISEEHHREIQKIRENVFDLLDYLRAESLVHVLAHPLYRVNDRLTPTHFEKLLLMFENFELNGARSDESNALLKRILGALTPDTLTRLANKHDMVPWGDRPWRKNLTGGSDDHSSLHIARTYTQINGAKSLEAFLLGIQSGDAEVIRTQASPKTLAHNLYGIAYQYYRNKFGLATPAGSDLLMRFIDQSLRTNVDESEAGLIRRLTDIWQHRGRRKKNGKVSFLPDSLIELLRQESKRLIDDQPGLIHLTDEAGSRPTEESWFVFVTQAANRVVKHFADHLMDQLAGGRVFNLFQTIGAAGGLYTLMAPYFIAFSLFERDRRFNETLKAALGDMISRVPKGEETVVAHFTDTFYEVNGVALTLRQQAAVAHKNGKRLTVVTCDATDRPAEPGIQNFTPIGVYELPEYPEQKLFYPPLLEMIAWCYENGVTHIHSATPGPVGLAALAVSRILNLPISGTYHTQIPQYAMFLTGDSVIEDLAWKYTLWYYDQMAIVYAPSQSTRNELVEKGIRSEKVHTYPRGIDVERFHPAKGNGMFRQRCGIDAEIVFLYVGRVSKEKNLEMLADAFICLARGRKDVHLVVVGDGPYRKEMARRLDGFPCTFTGYLQGEALSRTYASGDVFVFPSETDTFGNVVLEAQASGLPVIISQQGGPVENVVPEKTALVMEKAEKALLGRLMDQLASNPQLRRHMGQRARRYAEERSFDRAFLKTWQMYAAQRVGAERRRSVA